MGDIEKDRQALIQAITKTINLHGYYGHEILRLIVEDYNGYYLSLADEFGKVTYSKDPKDKLNEKKRIKTSFRRFIRRQLNCPANQYTDSWLNRFGCKVLSYLPYDLDSRISLLKGNQIIDFYSKTFVKTCMTGVPHKEKIAFYAINSDKVSLAVMDNSVRAFVWNTDEGDIVFDRVYPADDIDMIELIRSWAKSKNYKLRCVPASVVPINETVEIEGGLKYKVTLQPNIYYPYLDTFRFGTIENGKVILSNDTNFGNLTFARTTGYFDENPICYYCNRISRKSCQLIQNQMCCIDCRNLLFKRCYNCGHWFNINTITAEQSQTRSFTGYDICRNCYDKYYGGYPNY